ncbi:RNA-binding domain-containing protein [Rhodopirellula sp. P2]|uniref:RNA-binding domain-containing protein n=1 Tax=Rhodopirellula sp. P2 TaxID=2127060 RepID=UPI002368D718|nr:RNA-binding domain-containing protein [Rhodopirellula sp. P2]WDQ14569.1 ATP-binding protein [Rhodopirellula sp. P2]
MLRAIRLGEDSHLELKEVVISGKKVKGPSRDDIADEMAAFANAKGGVLVMGVDDKSRDIIGIPIDKLDLVEDLLREVAQDSLEPPLLLDIRREELPDELGNPQAIIRADIDRSLFVHSSRGRYWYRVGSSKRQMTPDYLGRLMQQRSQARLIRFDEQIIPGVSIEVLNSKLVARYRTDRSTDDLVTFLRKLAMVDQDQDGVLRPTVCGLLLGCQEPEVYLPAAYVQAVAYRGTADESPMNLSGYQLDQKDIAGPIDQQVLDSVRFVAKHMRVIGSKSAGRSDQPQYDLTAIFEAIVNAVAHRDYSMSGSRIRLRVFADRIELFVPGALANTMTVDSLPMRQAARNEAITSLLAKTQFELDLDGFESSRSYMMDRRGEGVSLILGRSEALSGKKPTYETIDESELKLTIFGADSHSPELVQEERP